MTYREIIAVCSQIHTILIHTLCEQRAELLNVKLGGTYSDYWTINVSVFTRLFAPVGTSRPLFRTSSITLLYSRFMKREQMKFMYIMHVANCEGFSDKSFVCCLSVFCCYFSQVSGFCSTLFKSIVTLANNTAMNPEDDS